MRKSSSYWFPLLFLSLCLGADISVVQQKQPLQLVQSIVLPNVKGRIDHMDVDVKGKRLFVAGLENGSVEIVDLRNGKWSKSIPGFQKPQGIAYIEALNKLFVASGDDAMLRVFHADTMQLADSIKLETGPNRVTYDPGRQILYVGYDGKDGGKTSGQVAVIDAKSDKHEGDIHVASHPAELLLDESGGTLFVFLPGESKIQVIDTKKREVISTWPVSSVKPGDGAYDDAHKRLFIGTRTPPRMIAMDSLSGKEIADLPTVEGQDGVYYDAIHKRVYVSGGKGANGSISVYQQKDADHYEALAAVATRPGAGTSFWSPEMNRYYVAAPAQDNDPAAILVFEPEP